MMAEESDGSTFSSGDHSKHDEEWIYLRCATLDDKMDEEKAVAVVGLGCRFPGANDKDEYWRLLENGENHVTDIKDKRPGFESSHLTDPNDPGLRRAYRAGLVERFSNWDNQVFGIMDEEAKWVDPQQRFVLDCVHMAMEDGGITRNELDGSNTGVYIGVMNDDFKNVILENQDSEESSFMVTGLSLSMISNRVSYVYNLHGPSMVIDTACSSSLVAIHQGSLALKAGECDIAICGGVNLILDSRVFVPLFNSGMLSPTGQCHAFTSNADGYTRGEGCGIVILKRVQDALEHENKIWGLVGTAINQDGHEATPITAPSKNQQLALLKKIYAEYNVHSSSVHVIEAHGTGTPVGDAVEAEALGNFFYKTNSSATKYIGSVKSNIGHLESASGVAGLIKVLLMMKNEKVVPSLHVKEEGINIKTKIEHNGLTIPTETVEWLNQNTNARTACVNSFGYGGTNAHAIVREYKRKKHVHKSSPGSSPQTKRKKHVHESSPATKTEPVIVVISATSNDALHANIRKIIPRLDAADYDLREISFTSTCKREHFPVRIGFVVTTPDELRIACEKYLTKNSVESGKKGKIKVVFVFCGVGTVWQGMCSESTGIVAFKSMLNEVDRLLMEYTGWSIIEKMKSPEVETNPMISHIALFACQVSLLEQWRSFEILPDCVVGQSVGEVAAAYASGAISLKTAVKIIYERASCLCTVTGGKMIVVDGLDISKLEHMCKTQGRHVCIAVRNSPVSATLSGDAEDIEAVKKEVKTEKQTTIKELQVSCAYHSHHVDKVREGFVKSLSEINGSLPTVPIISTVSGKSAENGDFTTAQYWGRNLREQVQFDEAIQLSADEYKTTVFLEIGPHPVLASHLKNILPSKSAFCLPSMKKGDEKVAWRKSMVKLYTLNLNPKWENAVERTHNLADMPHCSLIGKVTMPPMGFVTGSSAKSYSSHLYVRKYQQHEDGSHCYKVKINTEETPFVFEHLIDNKVVVPGTLYVDAGLEIGKCQFGQPLKNVVVEIEFIKTLTVNVTAGTEIFVSVEKDQAPDGKISCHFEAKSNGILRAKGCARISDAPCYDRVDIADVKSRFSVSFLKEDIYRKLEGLGFRYGESFRLLDKCWTKPGECFAELGLHDNILHALDKTVIQPSVLDCMLQTSAFVLNDENIPKSVQILPIGIGSVRVVKYSQHGRLFSYLQLTSTNTTDKVIEIHANACLMDGDGYPLVYVKNFTACGKIPVVLLPRELKYVKTIKQYPGSKVAETCESSNVLVVHAEKTSSDASFLDHENTIYATSIDTFCETLLEPAVMNLVKKDQLFKVALVVGDPMLDNILEDGCKKMERAKRNCLILKLIIKVLHELSQHPPVFVITDNSQGLIYSDKTPINIHGSEMWGLVRCIQKELTYTDVFLIDIVSFEENKEMLRHIISQPVKSLKSFPSEIILHQKEIFVLQLNSSSTTDTESKTKIIQRSDQRVLLKEHSLNFPRDPYLVTDNDIPEKVNSGWVRVEVESVCIQEEFNNRACLAGGSISNIGIFDDEGYHILSLEIRGYVEGADDRSPSFAQNVLQIYSRRCDYEPLVEDLPSSDRQEVVVCYPVKAGSSVIVPEPCVVRKDAIPNYFPGMLTFAVRTWSLLQTFERDQKLGVFIDNNSQQNYNQQIIYMPDELIVDFLDLGQPVENIRKQTNLMTCVLLKPLEPEQEQCFLTHLQNCRELICIRSFLRQPLQKLLAWEKCVKCKCLEEHEIFSRERLPLVVPKVVEWLHSKGIPELLQQFKADSFGTLREVDLKQTHGRDSLKLELQKHQLFDKMSTYIVVGGLTGLGWVILKLLANMGAGIIATLSRRGTSKEKEEEIRQIENENGCKIACLQADVSDMKSLEGAICELNSRFPRHHVRGIFQGAGVLDSNLFLEMTKTNFETVMLPKIAGSWNLHCLSVSRNFPLDFFIMHSSVAGVFGTVGNSNYGAANAVLDTLALYRRQKGLPGQSIAWGGLQVGMADTELFATKLETKGYLRLDVDQIRDCFVHALMQDLPQIIYTKLEWKKISEDYSKPGMVRLAYKIDPILRAKNLKISSESRDTNNIPNVNWQAFSKADLSTRLSIITDMLAAIIGKVSNIDSSELRSETLITEAGVDSLAAIQFSNILSDIFKCKIHFRTLVSPGTNIQLIAKYLSENIDVQQMLATESEFLPGSSDNHGTVIKKLVYS